MTDSKTHFGEREVTESEKTSLVADVFRSVAGKYDLMNDLMSFGIHRLWKRYTIQRAAVRPGQRVLDVAAGTGDLARGYGERLRGQGQLVVTDINDAMLELGREALVNAGLVGNVHFVLCDAETLPFTDNTFDLVSIGFGLRNVTRQQRALESMYRCLRPGGRVLILEFSRPSTEVIRRLYDVYSYNALPKLGHWVAGDEDSYRYLVESIRRMPPQEELADMMTAAGFERVYYHNLSGGIVALHMGCKL
ncbi:MAG TPA: bifunctional demethylmenaquinone methyltransferase/2-methoxy-6-polyprenyl-1,4-benzoquinol methylase UbiE [Arenicellales bacterium]|nr:bifunctional demethylmenaquinone methyltransferase/2-methoxy-6-polyprenyl-1,4-benzoquinol methylase UbiE [Arenicellales bacterium]